MEIFAVSVLLIGFVNGAPSPPISTIPSSLNVAQPYYPYPAALPSHSPASVLPVPFQPIPSSSGPLYDVDGMMKPSSPEEIVIVPHPGTPEDYEEVVGILSDLTVIKGDEANDSDEDSDEDDDEYDDSYEYSDEDDDEDDDSDSEDEDDDDLPLNGGVVYSPQPPTLETNMNRPALKPKPTKIQTGNILPPVTMTNPLNPSNNHVNSLIPMVPLVEPSIDSTQNSGNSVGESLNNPPTVGVPVESVIDYVFSSGVSPVSQKPNQLNANRGPAVNPIVSSLTGSVNVVNSELLDDPVRDSPLNAAVVSSNVNGVVTSLESVAENPMGVSQTVSTIPESAIVFPSDIESVSALEPVPSPVDPLFTPLNPSDVYPSGTVTPLSDTEASFLEGDSLFPSRLGDKFPSKLHYLGVEIPLQSMKSVSRKSRSSRSLVTDDSLQLSDDHTESSLPIVADRIENEDKIASISLLEETTKESRPNSRSEIIVSSSSDLENKTLSPEKSGSSITEPVLVDVPISSPRIISRRKLSSIDTPVVKPKRILRRKLSKFVFPESNNPTVSPNLAVLNSANDGPNTELSASIDVTVPNGETNSLNLESSASAKFSAQNDPDFSKISKETFNQMFNEGIPSHTQLKTTVPLQGSPANSILVSSPMLHIATNEALVETPEIMPITSDTETLEVLPQLQQNNPSEMKSPIVETSTVQISRSDILDKKSRDSSVKELFVKDTDIPSLESSLVDTSILGSVNSESKDKMIKKTKDESVTGVSRRSESKTQEVSPEVIENNPSFKSSSFNSPNQERSTSDSSARTIKIANQQSPKGKFIPSHLKKKPSFLNRSTVKSSENDNPLFLRSKTDIKTLFSRRRSAMIRPPSVETLFGKNGITTTRRPIVIRNVDRTTRSPPVNKVLGNHRHNYD